MHIAATTEAMALGPCAWVDPHTLDEVISDSAGSSWLFQNRAAHSRAGDFTPLSAGDFFAKDLSSVLDDAKKPVLPLTFSATAHQMFMQASAAGFAREDDAAVIKTFPGVELCATQATPA